MIKKLLIGSFLFCFFSIGSAAIPSTYQSWPEFIQEIRAEAITEGVSPPLFDQIFHNMKPGRSHQQLERSQPEKRITFYQYRKTRADAYRIKLGRQEYRRYYSLLNKIGEEYQVDPCMITALWGLESSYGRFMGGFPVIQSLATLAYSSKRYNFFHKELMLALQIVNQGHIHYKDYKGEWAGGSGQAQFLPSSWKHYAVDYNKDGLKDIWKTQADVFASIANYLAQSGWAYHQPWGIEVTLPPHFDTRLIGYQTKMTVNQWRQRGIMLASDEYFPRENLTASLIQPEGGPIFMIFPNFRVLLRWNRSSFYVGTVGYMAQEICKAH